MTDVSHTNPHTGETAGRLFTRGPTVAADGGRDDAAVPETADEQTDAQSMKDVSHTPPKDATTPNRVFERGGRETDVEESEE